MIGGSNCSHVRAARSGLPTSDDGCGAIVGSTGEATGDFQSCLHTQFPSSNRHTEILLDRQWKQRTWPQLTRKKWLISSELSLDQILLLSIFGLEHPKFGALCVQHLHEKGPGRPSHSRQPEGEDPPSPEGSRFLGAGFRLLNWSFARSLNLHVNSRLVPASSV